ncbi:hypothetical protein ACEPPN_008144 [Leptodophora sp. 'Broadleaf-Isolate-01']
MNLNIRGKDRLQDLQTKIVLLEALNNTPADQAEKYLDGAAHNDSDSVTRVLSLSREINLTENLAFIASATDDPGKVLALAIEEEENGKGMNITLAVNNGGLENVRIGFEKIAKILQDVCKQGAAAQNAQDNLLREILALNHNRILCRLRSKHAVLRCNFKREKSDRPKTIPILVTAFREVSAKARTRVDSEILNDVRSHVEGLDKMFGRLEGLDKSKASSKQGLEILSQMVTTSSELSSSKALSVILAISNMEPTSKKFVCNAIGKLGRYCSAARFLCQAAMRFSIFDHIRVSVVKLPAVPLRVVQDPGIAVKDVITGLFKTEEFEHANSQLMLRLQKRRADFSQVCKAIASTKFIVHAEIQLLVHYELQNLALPPRIICSSKKACFLCNLFLELHGKYIVPSTHGKMYEKWTLPEGLEKLVGKQATDMESVILRFRNILDERLRREILVGDTRYPPPTESIAFVSAIWSEVREPSPTPIQRIDSGYEGGEKESVVSSSATIKPQSEIQPPYIMLPRGQAMSFELSRKTKLVKVSTPRIHLTFCYASWQESMTSLADSKSLDPDLGCRLTLSWLEESEVLGPGSTVVDLCKLRGSFQETFDQHAGSCDFYVLKDNNIVSVHTTYL